MKPSLRTRLVLGGIIAFAILVRAAVGFATQSWRISSADDHWGFGYEIGRVAGSLAAGEGFSYPTTPPQPTAWVAPAYPAFVAGVFLVFGQYTPQSAFVILFIQVIASACSCVLLYLLANRLYGPKVGIIGAFFLAIYPASIHFSAQKISSSTFFSTILLLLVFLLTSHVPKPTLHRSILLGIIFGIGALLDPLLIGVVIPFSVWLYWKWKPVGQTHGLLIVLMIGIFLVVLTPWAIRNYLVFGRFVLIKSNIGHEILVGNHEGSTGLLPPGMSGIERYIRGSKFPIDGLGLPEKELEYLRSLNESEKDEIYLKQGVDYIIENPKSFIRLTAIRFSRYWTILRLPRNALEMISLSAYLLMLVLGIAGCFVARRRRLPTGVLLIPLVFIPVAHYLTIVGLHRYRFPLEPIVIIFAALAVTSLTPRRILSGSVYPESNPAPAVDSKDQAP